MVLIDVRAQPIEATRVSRLSQSQTFRRRAA
jgi:hypothetical protein